MWRSHWNVECITATDYQIPELWYRHVLPVLPELQLVGQGMHSFIFHGNQLWHYYNISLLVSLKFQNNCIILTHSYLASPKSLVIIIYTFFSHQSPCIVTSNIQVYQLQHFYERCARNHYLLSRMIKCYVIYFQAPQDYVVKLQFVGNFGLYSEYNACYHWVEVKYKSDLGLEGPRFCGSSRPNVSVVSQSNEMMIVFRSNFSNDILVTQRGFQAVLTVGKSTNIPIFLICDWAHLGWMYGIGY